MLSAAATAETHPGFFASLAANSHHINSPMLVNSHPGHQPSSTNLHPASVLAISNTATQLANHDYDSCGRPRNTGHLRDAETGLDFMQARYYSSASGRFTSPDEWAGGIVDAYSGGEVEVPGPLLYADITDPQTLNKYAYVRNNPMRYVDPDGHNFGEFVEGVANAVGSDWLLGAGRWDTGPDDYKAGQKIGDMIMTFVGGVKALTGTIGAVGGAASCVPTGGGGCVAAAASAAQAVHGAGVAAVASAHLMSSQGPSSSGSSGSEPPELISNPKHHPNSASPEPKNAKDLYGRSIADKSGVRWAKDKDGTIHRFSAPSNGQTHWNGSTTGKKPIRMDDIPKEIREQLR